MVEANVCSTSNNWCTLLFVEENMGKVIRLKRIATSNESGTFGVLLDGSIPFCVTLEPPLILGENGMSTPFISSIPAGIYKAHRINSPKFGTTFEIKDTDGGDIEGGNRNHVIFHTGNWSHQTKGCCLLAESFNGNGVGQSRDGFGEFMHRLREYEYFIFQITEDY